MICPSCGGKAVFTPENSVGYFDHSPGCRLDTTGAYKPEVVERNIEVGSGRMFSPGLRQDMGMGSAGGTRGTSRVARGRTLSFSSL